MFRRNDEGQVIDPPVLPEYEAKLQIAHAAADEVAIERINEEYDKAREEEVSYREAREREQAEDSETALLADDENAENPVATESERRGMFR